MKRASYTAASGASAKATTARYEMTMSSSSPLASGATRAAFTLNEAPFAVTDSSITATSAPSSTRGGLLRAAMPACV